MSADSLERNPDQTFRNPLVVELKSNNESVFFNKISKNFCATACNFSLFNSFYTGYSTNVFYTGKGIDPIYLTPKLKVMRTTNLTCD